HDRLGQGAHLDEQIPELERGGAVLLDRPVGRREELVQIHPRAKVLPRAADHHQPDTGVQVRPVEKLRERLHHGRVDGVLLVRTIQRSGENAFGQGNENAITHLGTLICMRSRAVENTFPCASVLSEMVPPPSSAPCNRKLSAFRFGSSKRSTDPVITPLKWRRTRAAVTSFTRTG